MARMISAVHARTASRSVVSEPKRDRSSGSPMRMRTSLRGKGRMTLL